MGDLEHDTIMTDYLFALVSKSRFELPSYHIKLHNFAWFEGFITTEIKKIDTKAFQQNT